MDDPRKRVPLYASRVADLSEERHVGCECRNCGHLADVPVAIVQAKLSPDMLVQRFRCVKCRARGATVHHLAQALGWDRGEGG